MIVGKAERKLRLQASRRFSESKYARGSGISSSKLESFVLRLAWCSADRWTTDGMTSPVLPRAPSPRLTWADMVKNCFNPSPRNICSTGFDEFHNDEGDVSVSSAQS